jgi:hypothetical protein
MMGWTFTQHCCRACMGTVMQSESQFICAICRATAEGAPNAICGCGATVRGPVGLRPAGLRCIRNPHPSRANPSHVLIALGGAT